MSSLKISNPNRVQTSGEVALFNGSVEFYWPSTHVRRTLFTNEACTKAAEWLILLDAKGYPLVDLWVMDPAAYEGVFRNAAGVIVRTGLLSDNLDTLNAAPEGTVLDPGSTVPEAPNNDRIYGRQNQMWVESIAASDIGTRLPELGFDGIVKDIYLPDPPIPPVLGTIAQQNANAVAVTGGSMGGVAITGGTVNATPIGATMPSSVRGTSVTATGGITAAGDASVGGTLSVTGTLTARGGIQVGPTVGTSVVGSTPDLLTLNSSGGGQLSLTSAGLASTVPFTASSLIANGSVTASGSISANGDVIGDVGRFRATQVGVSGVGQFYDAGDHSLHTQSGSGAITVSPTISGTNVLWDAPSVRSRTFRFTDIGGYSALLTGDQGIVVGLPNLSGGVGSTGLDMALLTEGLVVSNSTNGTNYARFRVDGTSGDVKTVGKVTAAGDVIGANLVASGLVLLGNGLGGALIWDSPGATMFMTTPGTVGNVYVSNSGSGTNVPFAAPSITAAGLLKADSIQLGSGVGNGLLADSTSIQMQTSAGTAFNLNPYRLLSNTPVEAPYVTSTFAGDGSAITFSKGTFIPTVSGSTSVGVGTYTTQLGTWQLVGNTIRVSIIVAWSVHTGTGSIRIENIPYGAQNVYTSHSLVAGSIGIGRYNTLCYAVSSPVIYVQSIEPGTGTIVDVTLTPTDGAIYLTLEYEIS